uniref:Protein kinase domain-containing protein n=1 Tax=Oryzias latipes TaxID=8090 RepID=A0A3P9HXB0_ORYLA
ETGLVISKKRSSQFQYPAILKSNKHVYMQMCFLGQGSFGAVIHYQQCSTFKNVAVKILATNNGIRESKMLDKIKCADPDKNNLLKLVEHFSLGLQHCIVFEKLDQDVFHFMSKRNRKPMEVSEIRPIAQQILVALNALKSMGLAHTDIKPDNLMLVNHATHPFKVKLIDFGLARNISDLKRTSQIQAMGYRAPEAVFGLPMNESVDMWSLGCSLVFMYFFKHLYPRTSEYEYIATIVRMAIGTIDNVLYDHKKCRYYSQMQSTISHGDSLKLKDVTEFESLLKQMLCVNSKNRITPEEALKHNFISMNHLSKRPLCTKSILTGSESVVGRSAGPNLPAAASTFSLLTEDVVMGVSSTAKKQALLYNNQ